MLSPPFAIRPFVCQWLDCYPDVCNICLRGRTQAAAAKGEKEREREEDWEVVEVERGKKCFPLPFAPFSILILRATALVVISL